MNLISTESSRESILIQKSDIEQQLSELSNLFDGLDNPAVAEKVAKLEVQKAEISSKLTRLNSEIECTKTEISIISAKIAKGSERATKQILDAIIGQRLFFIKNRKKILFDSQTGLIFINYHYFDDIPTWFDANMNSNEFNRDSKKYINYELYSYIFNHPDEQNYRYYGSAIECIFEHFFTDKPFNNVITNNSKSINNQFIGFIFMDGTYRNSSISIHSGLVLSYPFCDKFVSDDFLSDNNVFSPQERAQKVLNLFIQEGWIPKFDDE